MQATTKLDNHYSSTHELKRNQNNVLHHYLILIVKQVADKNAILLTDTASGVIPSQEGLAALILQRCLNQRTRVFLPRWPGI